MKFAYTCPDGGLSIVIAAKKSDIERVLGSLTDEQYKAHVLERSIPNGASEVTILPDDWQSPADRTFRNAWVKRGMAIEVDMPKARNIHRDRLRIQRKQLLEALDVEAIRASEVDDKSALARVVSRKKTLRDLPAHPAIEAAKTPDDLKAVTVDIED